MGSVFSGNRSFRGGRQTTGSLPEARLCNQRLYSVASLAVPRVRPEADGWATVIYGALEWPVLLETTPVKFGGVRRWMICPRCSTRRQVLYVKGADLACRCCLALRFESQHENRRTLLFRRLDKIRAKLGWQPGVLAPVGGKPSGMHWRTYRRLRGEVEQLTDCLLHVLNDWISRAEDAIDARE